jgi:hypothetical protein
VDSKLRPSPLPEGAKLSVSASDLLDDRGRSQADKHVALKILEIAFEAFGRMYFRAE